ncbi:DNA repair protein XRCC2 homolog [Telopea speciosissima]|uniref:DNA repair protein XRCC2 homolog n=1 Tax=Telopea speciosissima TaxID=54955 RepID=UPI001CC47563|nr:DNA repair protein XRCC2 homolog [Telopea speciosissima]
MDSATELGEWINGDESAKEMLERILTERPLLLLPPLHRVPLRVGNVVEIVGPSPSAKTQILVQAAISCVLPREWNGVYYGGLERLVIYFDLDCRFDILRLSESLKLHIMEANRSSNVNNQGPNEDFNFNEELFVSCMKRFLYVRCYNSFEFLASLKTLHCQLQKECEAHGVGVHILMIDSISAFYWVDRASAMLSIGGDKRKSISLQSVAETVVQEIQKLLEVQPMLVLASKATIFGDGSLSSEAKRKWSSQDTSDLKTSRMDPQKYSYRDYMPSVWQSFITHRVLVRVSDEDLANSKHQITPIYETEWLLPPLSFLDKFTVKDAGIFMIA